MGKTVEYQGYKIQSTPHHLADSETWRLRIFISFKHGRVKTRELSTGVVYATEQDADTHGIAFGQRLIDGKLEGRSVMDMRMEDRLATPRSLAEKIAAPGHTCKIPFTHDRLQEMHYWWHQMARNYHEPDPFRYSLGAFVQTGRSVSWMLQKEKAVFDDFRWYQSWVKEAKKDQVLCWIGDTRTDIVHRQALQPHSWLEMRCIDNPRDPTGEEDDNPIGTKDPFNCTHYYLFNVSSPDHTHEFKRLWEIEGLQGRELLEACADIYDRIEQLVEKAHQHLGGRMALSKGGMTLYGHQKSDRALPCMQNTMKFRVVRTAIRDGQEVWEDEPPGLHTQ